MNEKSPTVRHSLSKIKAMRERGQDQTSPEAPEAESLGAEFWSSARVVIAGREDLRTSAPGQRCGGLVQSQREGASDPYECRAPGLRRGPEALSPTELISHAEDAEHT